MAVVQGVEPMKVLAIHSVSELSTCSSVLLGRSDMHLAWLHFIQYAGKFWRLF